MSDFSPAPRKLPTGPCTPPPFLPIFVHTSEIRGLLKKPIIDVLIPAYNEERSIGKVIEDLPRHMVRHIVVCNNNSSDSTDEVARRHGAKVVYEPAKGYGNACLAGIKHLRGLEQRPDIAVFIDGDYSDHPDQLPDLIHPIVHEGVDLVIGSRALGNLEKGAMQPHQRFGNWLASRLIHIFYGYRFTDLGPFRAIRWDQLEALEMQDTNYGWTVEMQVKAAKLKLKTMEVPVDYRPRIGQSKVSGTVKGSVLAGYKIIWTIFKHL